jgi:hypothetical protein
MLAPKATRGIRALRAIRVRLGIPGRKAPRVVPEIKASKAILGLREPPATQARKEPLAAKVRLVI